MREPFGIGRHERSFRRHVLFGLGRGERSFRRHVPFGLGRGERSFRRRSRPGGLSPDTIASSSTVNRTYSEMSRLEIFWTLPDEPHQYGA